MSPFPTSPKRVLIVSPHWPPSNAPDMQRARMSLPYYRANGWEPIVLAVDDRTAGGAREPDLVRTVPPEIEVHAVPAFSPGWTGSIGVSNLGWRSWLPLLRAGSRIIRERQVDLVFITNTQFVTFTLGRIWRWRHGVPYVLDVQDPWRTDYYERPGARPPPGGWKYQVARFMAWALESWSFRRAGAVMSVSPDYLEAFRRRYPWFRDTPSEVIRFGASRADLAAAQKLPAPERRNPAGTISIVYTGAAGPIVPHAVSILFEAVARYRKSNPERAARLHFDFVGTSYVPAGRGTDSIRPIAERFGVADLVSEIPHRIGHLEAIRRQLAADILLLPGSSDLAYSPSKLYPYFLSGRPMLAIVFKNSVLERLVDDLKCASVVRISEGDANSAAAGKIGEFLDAALAPGGARPAAGRDSRKFEEEFLAEELTRRQCALFQRGLEHG